MAQGRDFLMQLASQHAQRAGLPPPLFHNLVNQESRWNTNAVSPAGAIGLSQIMPATARSPGFGVAPISNPYDPAENLRFGADYAGAMYQRYNQDPVRMAIAYNAGPGVADKWDGNMASLPKETQGYVQNVAMPFLQQQGGQGPQNDAMYGAGQDIAAPPLPPSLLDMPASGNSPVTSIADLDIAQGGNKFHPGLGLRSIGAAIAAGSQGVSAADALGKIRESYFAEQDAAYAKQREEMARQAAVQILGGPESALGQAVLQGMPLEDAMQVYAQERGFQQQSSMQQQGFYHDRTMQEDQQVFGAGQQQAGFGHDYGMEAARHGYQTERMAIEDQYQRGLISLEQRNAMIRQADSQRHDITRMGMEQDFSRTEAATDRDWRTGERVSGQEFTAGENAADRKIREDSLRAQIEESKRNFNTEVTRAVNRGSVGRDFVARAIEAAGDAAGAAQIRQMQPTAFEDPSMVNTIMDNLKAAESPLSEAAKISSYVRIEEDLRAAGRTSEADAIREMLLTKGTGTKVDINMGETMPGLAKLDPGTDYVRDENGQPLRGPDGKLQVYAIPGSKAAVEQATEAEKAAREERANEAARMSGVSNEVYKSSTVIRELDDAIDMAGPMTTGLGAQLTGWIGSSPAMNMKAKLSTIGANIAFDRLTQMRKESPTGGALGSITEGELKLLQDTMGSIEQLQDSGQMRATLNNIRGRYLDMIRRVQTSDASDAEKLRVLELMGVRPSSIQEVVGGQPDADGWATTGSGVKYRVKQ